MEAKFARLALGHHAADELMQRGIARQLEQRQPLEALSPEPDGPKKSLIAKRHSQIGIDGEHAFGHAPQDGLTARGFEAKAVYQGAQLPRDSRQRAFQRREVI